jgi:hypothetical protein
MLLVSTRLLASWLEVPVFGRMSRKFVLVVGEQYGRNIRLWRNRQAFCSTGGLMNWCDRKINPRRVLKMAVALLRMFTSVHFILRLIEKKPLSFHSETE